ncbi:MAG: MFS transporter [FCB group bacterium]|nr:MFS transporter [FCB group bacterium]
MYKDSFDLIKNSLPARRILIYGSLSGMIYAAVLFGEVIARKSLNASTLQVTMISMTMPFMTITSIWWGRLLVGRDQRKVIWIIGTIGIIALASGVFLETFLHLLIIYIIYFISYSLQLTAQNRVFQQHLPAKQTGGLFGISQGMRMGVAAVTSAAAGWWLEHADKGWQEIHLIVSLAGLISVASIASIPTKEDKSIQALRFKQWFLTPLKDVGALLKARPDYLRFEIAFMIYGAAFMMTLPVVPIYLVDDLKMGYGVIGLTKGLAFQIIMVLGIPFFGRIFDNSTPHRVGAITFLLASAFPLILLAAEPFQGTLQALIVALAFLVFGAAMSGVTIIWNLASLRFTGKLDDAGQYQSVHVAAVGIRGMFAPMLGYFVMRWLGNQAALLTASALFITASVSMIAARWYDSRSGNMLSLRVEE